MTEMDLEASETLLVDFHRLGRRQRRRRRRRQRREQERAAAGEDVRDGGEGNQPEVNLNDAIHEGNDGGPAGSGSDAGEDSSDGIDDWSHDRIDRARELERLEQILLRENAQFILHC